MPNVQEFKNALGEGVRPNRYRVTIGLPAVAGGDKEVRRISLLCKTNTIPPSSLGVVETFFQGRQVPLPGDREFEDWTVSVLIDSEHVTKDAFERWSNAIDAHSDATGLPISEILADAVVEQLNRRDEVIKTYEMLSAFPTQVGEVEQGYENNDELAEFQITFRYQHWGSNTTS